MVIIFRKYFVINLLFFINKFLEPLLKLFEVLSPPPFLCFPFLGGGVSFVLQLQTLDEFGVDAVSFEPRILMILLFISRQDLFLPRLLNI